MTDILSFISSEPRLTPICCIAKALQEQDLGPVGLHLLETTMFVTFILSKVRSYMRYRETVRELSQLSDRELEDLGISRFQIDSIARQHAVA
jgi:uncharacterized protein YjiS (DUF1127 family)